MTEVMGWLSIFPFPVDSSGLFYGAGGVTDPDSGAPNVYAIGHVCGDRRRKEKKLQRVFFFFEAKRCISHDDLVWWWLGHFVCCQMAHWCVVSRGDLTCSRWLVRLLQRK